MGEPCDVLTSIRKNLLQSLGVLWLRWQSVCLQCGRPGFDPWVGNIPWRRKWQSTPVLLPGKSHGQRSLVGYSPWGCKESDRLSDCTFTFRHVAIVVKNLPANAGHQETRVQSLGQEDSPGRGHDHALQYSCLENLMDRRNWQATVHGVTKQLGMT